MLICPHCKKELQQTDGGMKCPACATNFPIREGIQTFVDTPPAQDEGYREGCFEVAHDIVENLFWFRKRNDAILHLFRRYVNPKGRIIEIGCGTGLVLEFLRKNGFRADGGEIHLTALNMICERKDANYYLIDVTKLPFSEEYDAVGMFDVLEHIDNDAAAIANVGQTLKKDGLFILTVPAKEKLRSHYDDVLCHKRRYELKPLRTLLERNGFEVLKISYLFFFLYPFAYLNRALLQKRKSADRTEEEYFFKELMLPPALNLLFGLISGVEMAMFPYTNFPAGNTIIAAARKK